jgi:hypothetical protein
MRSWKTSLAGLLAGLGQILPMMGFSQDLGAAIGVIGLALLGLLAKDSNVTGGTVAQ